MSTKTAVVTGGAGFVGSHISDALKNEGWTVIVLDNLSSGKESNLSDKIELEIFDITKDNVETIFRKIKPDKIFHTAAQISVNQSTKNPFYDANQNIIGTIKVLDAIRIIGKGIEPFVFLSTGGAIYGNTDKFPVNENTYPNPESPYAISKFSAENYVRYFRRNYSLNTSIIRPANIYGPRQDPNGEAGVVAIFIKAMLLEKKVNIFGKGDNIRDYVHVKDIVKGCILASELSYKGPINLGTGKGTTVLELFNYLSKYCNYNLSPNFIKERPGDVKSITLDCSLAEKILNWSPNNDLEEGLKNTIKWFKNYSGNFK